MNLSNKAVVIEKPLHERKIRKLCSSLGYRIASSRGFKFPFYYMFVPTMNGDAKETYLVPNSGLEAADGETGVSDRGYTPITFMQFERLAMGEAQDE